MGLGMSTELGAGSHVDENKNYLKKLCQRLSENDENLTLVDCANRYIGDDALRDNVFCMDHNTYVTHIDLMYNNLTALCVPCIISVLRDSPNIKVLSLAGNRIGAEGCRLLGEFLTENPELECLSLLHNDLYDADVVPLVNALLHNNNLAVLNLDLNPFTNAAWVMFHKLLVEGKQCGLVELGLTLDLEEDWSTSDHIVQEVEECLVANRARYERRCAARAALPLKKSRRDAAAAEAAAAVEAEAQRARDELAEQEMREAAEREEAKRAEELLMQAHQKRGGRAADRAERERMWRDRTIAQAYAWRARMTRNGTVIKQWRDGFTTISTRQGEPVGSTPTIVTQTPDRLKPCWCDPRDAVMPYAKTLHYHCRYEQMSQPTLENGQLAPYEGCRATSHPCASVGFSCRPLPDRSSAHFFASAPPRSAFESATN